MRFRFALLKHDMGRRAFVASLRVANLTPKWLRGAVVVNAAAKASYVHPQTAMPDLSPMELLENA